MSQFLSPEAARLRPIPPANSPGISNTSSSTPMKVRSAPRRRWRRPWPGRTPRPCSSTPTPPAPPCTAPSPGTTGWKNVTCWQATAPTRYWPLRSGLFAGTGRPAVYADVTYGFYQAQTALFGLESVRVPLREDYTLAVEDYMSAQGTVFIANPNAPTALPAAQRDPAAAGGGPAATRGGGRGLCGLRRRELCAPHRGVRQSPGGADHVQKPLPGRRTGGLCHWLPGPDRRSQPGEVQLQPL